ncbi:MAG: CHASE3 domain-containing protein [Chitinophagaceae bacterium]|nr:CHASE3 domain-containing protein [Chitinophagaceae bacterium]MCW5928273.1 CHASE3 domain-containing protein [Chitinophagaceae bacterium]
MIKSVKRIRLGYAIAFLLLLASYFLIISTNRRLEKEKKWILHNREQFKKITDIELAMREAESNAQGYLTSMNSHFLDRFRKNETAIDSLSRGLAVISNRDVALSDKKKQLQSMIDHRLADLTTAIRAQRGTTSVMPAVPDNSVHPDYIFQRLQEMRDIEESSMQYRVSRLNNFYTSTEAFIYLSLLIALIAAAYAITTFNTQLNRRRRMNQAANQYRMDLEKNVKELNEKNIELKSLRGIEKLAVIGRVARVMAHEIRNPLTNISLATQQLCDLPYAEKDEETHLLFNIIKRNSDRISQIVTDLLNATKYMQLDMQKENINTILDESLEMAKDRLLLKKIEVRKRYTPDICDILIDKERIKLAILNIIVNAIEAMDEKKGMLELITKTENNKCIIEIRDNGKGMSEETLYNVFEPYFTLKKKGNGLGLTHAQNIIINHKGSIKVESKEGIGTTFHIALNLA